MTPFRVRAAILIVFSLMGLLLLLPKVSAQLQPGGDGFPVLKGPQGNPGGFGGPLVTPNGGGGGFPAGGIGGPGNMPGGNAGFPGGNGGRDGPLTPLPTPGGAGGFNGPVMTNPGMNGPGMNIPSGPLFERIWSCEKCGKDIGRGNFPPANCPHCGVRLINGIGKGDKPSGGGNSGPIYPNNIPGAPNSGGLTPPMPAPPTNPPYTPVEPPNYTPNPTYPAYQPSTIQPADPSTSSNGPSIGRVLIIVAAVVTGVVIFIVAVIIVMIIVTRNASSSINQASRGKRRRRR